ncbi:MarR family transcriptional regulator [Iodobacter sp. CM08]|uniref:MarR family winged helix-turn-helix transcriptional regulator n=1 Tax=Iodobacter sp. CM08 TaxID=3085902 RepID=UPI0029814CB2|nr:MarR family transcriptional regulator [Iodobacter sp. CM08]MDW5417426.1 MarR family transcriptional regulator [Iodobacter sp. CM08]
MSTKQAADAVDVILGQWHQERPDLDVSPMGPIGRIRRCALLLQRKMDVVFTEYGMSNWEFDVLATLRRSGPPYCLAPTALFSSLMISSGTMTHRLKGLEASGWIERIPSSSDARSMLVQLSDAGFALIDQAVTAHVANEHAMLAAITPEALLELDARMAELLGALEGNAEGR